MKIDFCISPSMRLMNKYWGGAIKGAWSSQMDRDWIAEYEGNLLSVSSRLISHPKFGKIEHVGIQIKATIDVITTGFTNVNNELIQYIKDTLFSENRFAIQVYPKEENLIDIMNIYHIFIFDKNVKDPFVVPKDSLILEDDVQVFLDPGEDSDCLYTPIVHKYKTNVNILGISYPVTVLDFELHSSDTSTWSHKYAIMQQICGKNVFGIEHYPFNKQYLKMPKTENEHATIFVFDESIDMPFGIHPNEFYKTEYVNRGAYTLNRSQLEKVETILDKFKD